MPEAIEIDPEKLLHEHSTLPALPEVVSQLQEKILDANVNLNEIADMISDEPAILAQVLKVVNSAYYGLPTEVTKVRMAVAFLGLHEIYRMVLSLAVVNNLAVKEKKELDAFWFHTFFTARCAKHLAKQYEPLLSHEDLWPAAMLHDIGKLVYLKFYPDHYKQMITFCKDEGVMFHQAESHFGYPESAQLGIQLCKHWRLPEQAKQGCNFHTFENLIAESQNGDLKPIQRVVCLANLLAIVSTDELKNETKEQIIQAVSKQLKCNKEQFLALMGDVYQIKTEVEDFVRQF